jgi:hypothetical protein
MQDRSKSANEPLYVICRSGSRGQQARERFIKACYRNIVNVEGGTLAWEPCWIDRFVRPSRNKQTARISLFRLGLGQGERAVDDDFLA